MSNASKKDKVKRNEPSYNWLEKRHVRSPYEPYNDPGVDCSDDPGVTDGSQAAELDVICFPYFFNGKLINIKFRGPQKSFKLVSGAELVFFNLDCLTDNTEVIITEGEIDALSFIQAGFDNVLSVPNGANNNLEYLDNYVELFKSIEKIYIATDQDTKGIELRDELVRRFGADRCYIVSFKDCKDANEYLLKYGDALKDVIKESKPVPVKGIVETGNL